MGAAGAAGRAVPVGVGAGVTARRGPSRAGVARVVREQRRGYARKVVQGMARTQQGRPVGQVQRVLRDSLTPLGVRLTPGVLAQLAADISAGRAVALP